MVRSMQVTLKFILENLQVLNFTSKLVMCNLNNGDAVVISQFKKD